MKRKPVLIILILVMLLGLVSTAGAAASCKIYINGKCLEGIPNQIINGKTMVPLRTICEALGASVTWDKGAVYIESKLPNDQQHYVKVNGELTTWPYWMEDGKLYMEYRNAIQLVREANRAPLHTVAFYTHNNTLYVDDISIPLALHQEGEYKLISIDYLRDLGIIRFDWDPQQENFVIHN